MKGLEIAAVIENRDVLRHPNRSCLRNGFIHHLLCELGRDAVFLDDVGHWTFSFVYCALNPPRVRATPLPPIHLERATAETDRRTSADRSWDSACDASSSTTSQCSTRSPSTSVLLCSDS